MLTLKQKTHFQSQIAHTEEYRWPKARTIACSKLTKIVTVIYKDQILHMLRTIIAIVEVCNLLLINVQ